MIVGVIYITLSCDVIIEYEGPDGPKPLTLFEKLFMKDRWTFAATWKMYSRGQQQSIVHSMLTYADYVAKEMKRYVDLGLGLEIISMNNSNLIYNISIMIFG